MPLRRAHGERRGTGERLETSPADELPTPVPSPIPPPPPAPRVVFRDADGLTDWEASKLKPGEERTREMASRGGRARAERQARLKLIAGPDTPIRQSSEHYTYLRDAEEYFLCRIDQMAREVGGGQLSPDVIGLIAHEAQSLMWANYYFDKMEPDRAVKFAEAQSRFARQAFEYAVRYAKVRPKQDEDPGARLLVPTNGAPAIDSGDGDV